MPELSIVSSQPLTIASSQPLAEAGDQRGFWESLGDKLNPIPAMREWMSRPDSVRSNMDSLHVLNQIHNEAALDPANKGLPVNKWKLRQPTADEQTIIEKGMNTALPGAEGNALTEAAGPGVEAARQAGAGNYAGAAGTLAGGYGVPAAIGSIPAVARGVGSQLQSVAAKIPEKAYTRTGRGMGTLVGAHLGGGAGAIAGGEIGEMAGQSLAEKYRAKAAGANDLPTPPPAPGQPIPTPVPKDLRTVLDDMKDQGFTFKRNKAGEVVRDRSGKPVVVRADQAQPQPLPTPPPTPSASTAAPSAATSSPVNPIAQPQLSAGPETPVSTIPAPPPLNLSHPIVGDSTHSAIDHSAHEAARRVGAVTEPYRKAGMTNWANNIANSLKIHGITPEQLDSMSVEQIDQHIKDAGLSTSAASKRSPESIAQMKSRLRELWKAGTLPPPPPAPPAQ